jgi:hypothetical protein
MAAATLTMLVAAFVVIPANSGDLVDVRGWDNKTGRWQMRCMEAGAGRGILDGKLAIIPIKAGTAKGEGGGLGGGYNDVVVDDDDNSNNYGRYYTILAKSQTWA